MRIYLQIGLLLLFGALSFAGQEAAKDCNNDHGTDYEFYSNVRFLPITILSVDKDKQILYWKFESKKELILGSVSLTPKGKYDDLTKKTKYGLFYCQKHQLALLIEIIPK